MSNDWKVLVAPLLVEVQVGDVVMYGTSERLSWQ